MCHLYASLLLFTHILTCFHAFHWVAVNLDCWWSKGVQSSCMLLKIKGGRLNTMAPLRTLFIFVFSLAFCCSASCQHSKASCSCSKSRAENILKNILGATLLRSSVLSHSLNLHRRSIQKQTFDVSFYSICGPNTCKKFLKVKTTSGIGFWSLYLHVWGCNFPWMIHCSLFFVFMGKNHWMHFLNLFTLKQ